MSHNEIASPRLLTPRKYQAATTSAPSTRSTEKPSRSKNVTVRFWRSIRMRFNIVFGVLFVVLVAAPFVINHLVNTIVTRIQQEETSREALATLGHYYINRRSEIQAHSRRIFVWKRTADAFNALVQNQDFDKFMEYVDSVFYTSKGRWSGVGNANGFLFYTLDHSLLYGEYHRYSQDGFMDISTDVPAVFSFNFNYTIFKDLFRPETEAELLNIDAFAPTLVACSPVQDSSVANAEILGYGCLFGGLTPTLETVAENTDTCMKYIDTEEASTFYLGKANLAEGACPNYAENPTDTSIFIFESDVDDIYDVEYRFCGELEKTTKFTKTAAIGFFCLPDGFSQSKPRPTFSVETYYTPNESTIIVGYVYMAVYAVVFAVLVIYLSVMMNKILIKITQVEIESLRLMRIPKAHAKLAESYHGLRKPETITSVKRKVYRRITEKRRELIETCNEVDLLSDITDYSIEVKQEIIKHFEEKYKWHRRERRKIDRAMKYHLVFSKRPEDMIPDIEGGDGFEEFKSQYKLADVFKCVVSVGFFKGFASVNNMESQMWSMLDTVSLEFYLRGYHSDTFSVPQKRDCLLGIKETIANIQKWQQQPGYESGISSEVMSQLLLINQSKVQPHEIFRTLHRMRAELLDVLQPLFDKYIESKTFILMSKALLEFYGKSTYDELLKLLASI